MKKSQTRNRARRTLRRARKESQAALAPAPAQAAPPMQQEMHRLGVRGERQKGAMAKWASLLGRARRPKAAK